MTYETACLCLALSAALKAEQPALGSKNSEAKRFDEELRAALRKAAMAIARSQNRRGAWSYIIVSGTQVEGEATAVGVQYDNSNTQFAILGLGAAQGAGVEIPKGTWEKCLDHLRRDQNQDGGWGYFEGAGVRSKSYESMTSAGVGGLILALQALNPKKTPKELREDPHVERGLNWMANHYSLATGRSMFDGARLPGWGFFYDAYSLERAMMLSGVTLLDGRIDWYHDGAFELLKVQDKEGSWRSAVDTAFALLFLKRSFVTMTGRRK